jgi:3-oxoacyl-[acyl-carrier-protein] synthase I
MIADQLLEKLKQQSGDSPLSKKTGLIYATTTAQVDKWEAELPAYRHLRRQTHTEGAEFSDSVFEQSLGNPLDYLSARLENESPYKLTIASSCSAGLQAIAMGYQWILQEKVDACLVFATEILCQLTQSGFQGLRLIANGQSLPFSSNRKGINLGEAGAYILMERKPANASAKYLAQVKGASFNLDAFHPTAPHPEGEGSFLAMSDCLTQAGLSPNEIDWIYAHGTASPANDLSEARAINRLFGHENVYVTSTKSIHGHTLAASGLLESVIGIEAMLAGVVLPTLNDGVTDHQLGVKLAPQAFYKPVNYFIKNSLGFGGVNASVLFGRDL